jgi:hypothetical protein
VTFQSILNSEIWWSPVAGLGVVARPMGRSARAWVAGPDGVASRTGKSVPHGDRRRPLGGTREIQRRFNLSVPRARAPEKASTLRDRSER